MIMRREKNDVRITISVSARLSEYLKLLSEASGFSQSNIVRNSLEAYFENMPKNAKDLEAALDRLMRRG